MTFELGDVVATPGIVHLTNTVPGAHEKILECINRHAYGDWGDLCDEDKQMNDDALEAERKGEPTDRLFSSYETDIGKIYIITEYDRSVTTVLLPEEY